MASPVLVDYFRKWRRVSAIHEPSASLLSKAEFRRELARERIRSTRRSFPFCVLEIRLADRVNGRVSRRYCRVITSVLNRNVRLTDYKARLDGRTFAVLFTDTPEMGGRSAMNRIEELLKSRDVPATLRLEVFDPDGFGDDGFGDHADNLRPSEGASQASGFSPSDRPFSADPVSEGSVVHVGQRRDDRRQPNRHAEDGGDWSEMSVSTQDSLVQTGSATATLARPALRSVSNSPSDLSAPADDSWQRLDDRIAISKGIRTDALSLTGRVLKRSTDIAGATLGLICGGPVILLAMGLIRWTDGQSSLFKQTREGKDGKPFTIYKLRTMIVNAESKQDELRKLSHRDGPAFKIENDPRVTRIGHILRKTCIDELPQLWNVLRGEMSLVGPRPLPWRESRACNSWHRRRLDVRPGLTCYWQVDKDRVETFDDWMRMDLQYLERSSLWVDLRLIVRTIAVPIFGRGGH